MAKKFEVRFYVCFDVEMLVKHSLKNLMERDRHSQHLSPWRSPCVVLVGPLGMIRQIYSVVTKVAVELVELVETRRRTCCELTYNL